MMILDTIKIEREDAKKVFLLSEFIDIAYAIFQFDLKRLLE